MDKKRLEWKVGLFVFIGLVLLGALMLQFSKGAGTLFRKTYVLRLHADNLGSGLKKRAYVLMSGVQVGNVSDIKLSPDGKRVTIFLKIYHDYVVHSDAEFRIEQSGFLGDQYVAIVPQENAGPILTDNASVDCQPPLNLQEVARSAGGFIKRVDETVKQLNDIVADVRRLVLNQETLTNAAATVRNLREASERAVTAVNEVEMLLATNAPAISQSSSNISVFSTQLNEFADSLKGIVATNRESVSAAVKNFESSTAVLKSMIDDVNAGKGPAGALLRNEQIAADLTAIASNLSITTSNLNRSGLWGIMWAKKQPRANRLRRSWRRRKIPSSNLWLFGSSESSSLACAPPPATP